MFYRCPRLPLRHVALLLCALAVAASAPAQETPPPEAERKPRDRSTTTVVFDESHAYVSRRLEEYSRKVDAFFGESSRAYDSTGSTLQLRGYVSYFEGGRTEGRPELRAHVSLPDTEDRLKLVIQRGVTAATETALERDIKEATRSDQVAAAGAEQDDSYYLGLKALAGEALGIKFSVEGGVKFTFPLDPYVRLRAFRDFTVESWAIRVSETPLWKDSENFSTATEVSFGRQLGEDWLFRFTTKATWRNSTGYFDLAQIGALFYTFDRRTAFTLELGAFGPSEPSARPTVYSISFRARRQLYKDWLYVELVPQTIYQEANGFSPEHSVMLRLEMLFGDRYLQP